MYNKRAWLNSIKSDSTSSVVAFDGKVTDLDTSNKYIQRFLEIADCRGKIKLHKTSDDTDEDFLNKMKVLKNEIYAFIIHLEDQMKGKIEIIIPKGFMNVGVTTDNFFIADTNDSSNWDSLKFPLPEGKWNIFSSNGKNIILQNQKKL